MKGDVRVRIRNKNNTECLYAKPNNYLYTTDCKDQAYQDASVWILKPITLDRTATHPKNLDESKIGQLETMTIKIMNAATKEHVYCDYRYFFGEDRNVQIFKGNPEEQNTRYDWNLEWNPRDAQGKPREHNEYRLFNIYYWEHLFTSGSNVYAGRRYKEDDDGFWNDTNEWIFEIIHESLSE